MSESFRIRLATSADADTIAWHRARMFQDMGDVPPNLFDSFRAKSRDALNGLFARAEYIGWLASPDDEADRIVAGAGVHLRRLLPHPRQPPDGETVVAAGRHASIVNVFTEPEWRRRGLAELLLGEIIEWAKKEGLDELVLHASLEGQALYERLGFVMTSEMRFAGK